MINSQQFIPIETVDKDFIFLKDKSVGFILSVSAVNFALLFETEQISIIESFAGLLNSLSFPIQIVIYSKVLDVSSYLHVIDNAMARQANPLLKKMTVSYRNFVEKSIKDNNVLDKQFYICIKVTPIEIGLLPVNQDERIHKVQTLLYPRRDHLIRQLNRLGLKAKQLTTIEITKLFYNIYNPPEAVLVPEAIISTQKPEQVINNQAPPQQKLRPIKTSLNQIPAQLPKNQIIQPQIPNPPTSVSAQPQIQATTTSTPLQNQIINQTPNQTPLSSPFVVEELPDET